MSLRQQQASNPINSVWVSASAGTGKTKILTDRVLRLLLSGVAPEKILCLTFTNAAAAEMQQRINKKLVSWAKLNKILLKQDLTLLLTRSPNYNELIIAKNLYETSINSSNKINIHTIHSFCQKILKRFPLESKLSPGFQIIDDITSRELVTKAYHNLYSQEEGSDLINYFTANFHIETFKTILKEIIAHKIKFRNYINYNNFHHNKLPQIKNQLNILEYEIFSAIKNINYFANLYSDFSITKLENLITIVGSENISNEQLISFFLKKEDGARKKILSETTAKKYPDLNEYLINFQDIIYKTQQLKKEEIIAYYTNLVIELAKKFINLYDNLLNKYNYLDFEDLIYFTDKLLENSDARDWVLYKLEGGIDHILVDEAQDTSPTQWRIIQNLIEEFYAGQGIDDNINRTIFVVGDEKQSIFSFHGADVETFHLMNEYFKSRLISAHKKFDIIDLEYSYRSTPEILEIVYNIFNVIKANNPNYFKSFNPLIHASRSNVQGEVELWSLAQYSKAEKIFWPLPPDHNCELSPQIHLATKIAEYIKAELTTKRILPSINKIIQPEDFLIIIRKRDNLAHEIISQLHLHSLEAAGMDRIIISKDLSVNDLISIAKFVLSPHDDLNLASLLKSPVIGANDQRIENLIINKSISIWQQLQEEQLYINILEIFINLYNISHVGNFFHRLVDSLGYRAILTSYNGIDTNDAINELLYLSKNYAKTNSSLQNFIYWFDDYEVDIKRNIESSNKIRLMTAHGSKGLQAPIVILCDTTSTPVNKNQFIWTAENELIAAPKSNLLPEIFLPYKLQDKEYQIQEYLRLFYVALTRAEDKLIICGYSGAKHLSTESWYNFAEMTFQNYFPHKIIQLTPLTTTTSSSNYIPVNAFSFSLNNTIINNLLYSVDSVKERFNRLTRPIPSDQNLPFEFIKSPLIDTEYLKYGRILHKLLEDCFKMKDISKLSSHPIIETLSLSLKSRLYKAINKLLVNQEFTDLVAYDVKSEVSLGAIINNQMLIKRIDLLVFHENTITIIDYKSDIHTAKTHQEVPKSYIQQLHDYYQIISILYPQSSIICKIFWLQTAHFTTINI